MADKIWNLLEFLKNPVSDAGVNNIDSETDKRSINDTLIEVLQRTELAVDAELKAHAASPHDTDDIIQNDQSEDVAAETPNVDIDTQTNVSGYDTVQLVENTEVPEAINEVAVNDQDEDRNGHRLISIPVEKVRANPNQPRKVMVEEDIEELSRSIMELGVLQPILVRKTSDSYELIAGERRLRASRLAGISNIPAMVVETEPVEQQIMALVENIQRKDLTAIEEAYCLQDIIAKTGMSQTEAARRTGRSQASVANKLRLLKLDQSVQDLIAAGRLGERQARSLLNLSIEEQKELAKRAIDEELSARALEALAENWKDADKKKTSRTKDRKVNKDAKQGDLLDDLAALINKHRNKGTAAQWKVCKMDEDSLIVEITVDLTSGE